jgi:hypothetical protein
MRQVLYPKYLLGGVMNRGGSGINEAATEEGQGLMGGVGHLRGLVGRWPDADAVLQGGMSDGLRDWDLWYDLTTDYLLRCDTDKSFKGTSTLLPPTLIPPQHQRSGGSALAGVQRCLCNHLDCRSNCHPTDQTAGRHNVCSRPYTALFP